MQHAGPTQSSHRVNPSKMTTGHSREDSSIRQEFSCAGPMSDERRTSLAGGDPALLRQYCCEQKISRLSNPFRFDSTCNVEDVAEECTNEAGGKAGPVQRYKNLTIDVEEIEKFHYDLMQSELMQDAGVSNPEEQESYGAANEYNLVENQNEILATAECEDDEDYAEDEYRNAENYLSTQHVEPSSQQCLNQVQTQKSIIPSHQQHLSVIPPENSYMSLESFKNKLGKGIV